MHRQLYACSVLYMNLVFIVSGPRYWYICICTLQNWVTRISHEYRTYVWQSGTGCRACCRVLSKHTHIIHVRPILREKGVAIE